MFNGQAEEKGVKPGGPYVFHKAGRTFLTPELESREHET
jgi:hypothetical protein